MGKEDRVWHGVRKMTKILNRSWLWSGNRSKVSGRSIGVCLADGRSKRVCLTGDRSYNHVTGQRNGVIMS